MLSLDLLILESISSTLLIWSDKSDRSCWIQFIIFDHRWLWFTSTLIGNFMRSSSWCLQCLFRILCVLLVFCSGCTIRPFVSWMYDPAHGSSLSGPLCTYLKSLLHLNWKAVAMCFKEKITFRSNSHWSLIAFYTLRLQLWIFCNAIYMVSIINRWIEVFIHRTMHLVGYYGVNMQFC